MGRPVVWNEKKIKEVIEQMESYTDKAFLPMLSEFAYNHGYNRSQLYEYKGLSDAIKRMMMKKETKLQLMAISGKIHPSFAIFSLKQLGWSDKQEIQHDTKKSITVNIVDPKENNEN